MAAPSYVAAGKSKLGATGIDQMMVVEFERREGQLLVFIHEKLKAGTYRL